MELLCGEILSLDSHYIRITGGSAESLLTAKSWEEETLTILLVV